MTRSITKLFIAVLVFSMAWSLGTISAILRTETEALLRLEAAIDDRQKAMEALEQQRTAMDDDAAFIRLARKYGYSQKGDVVFFDGGEWIP